MDSKETGAQVYLDLIRMFAARSFTTPTLIQWLAPAAVQLGPQPMPRDQVYYLVQEKSVTLRTPQPGLGVVWWPSSEGQAEIQELHVKPLAVSLSYDDLLKQLAAGPEIRRRQGSPLADIEHTHPVTPSKGQNLELTLQEIRFADDPELIGLVGGLTLKKLPASPARVPQDTQLQTHLERHLLVGTWKAVSEPPIAQAIDFEAAFAEKSDKRGSLFRTYGQKGLLDEGVWTLESETRLRLVWKSGLIRAFDYVIKGDRLMLRDTSGLFRYRRSRRT